MALMGSAISGEVGLRMLLSPAGSNIVVRTACCAVGIVLPVFSTFKAIEKKDSNDQEKWLIYWAAYGSFSLVESFSDKLISWVPFYYHVKFAFLVWLQLPSHCGARRLYEGHLRPFLLRHQASLDRLLKLVSRELEKLVSRHQQEISFLEGVIMKSASALKAITHPGRHQAEAPPEQTDEAPPER
ncbi:HVA22-like protein K [Wolffia australiana]